MVSTPPEAAADCDAFIQTERQAVPVLGKEINDAINSKIDYSFEIFRLIDKAFELYILNLNVMKKNVLDRSI